MAWGGASACCIPPGLHQHPMASQLLSGHMFCFKIKLFQLQIIKRAEPNPRDRHAALGALFPFPLPKKKTPRNPPLTWLCSPERPAAEERWELMVTCYSSEMQSNQSRAGTRPARQCLRVHGINACPSHSRSCLNLMNAKYERRYCFPFCLPCWGQLWASYTAVFVSVTKLYSQPQDTRFLIFMHTYNEFVS